MPSFQGLRQSQQTWTHQNQTAIPISEIFQDFIEPFPGTLTVLNCHNMSNVMLTQSVLKTILALNCAESLIQGHIFVWYAQTSFILALLEYFQTISLLHLEFQKLIFDKVNIRTQMTPVAIHHIHLLENRVELWWRTVCFTPHKHLLSHSVLARVTDTWRGKTSGTKEKQTGVFRVSMKEAFGGHMLMSHSAYHVTPEPLRCENPTPYVCTDLTSGLRATACDIIEMSFNIHPEA